MIILFWCKKRLNNDTCLPAVGTAATVQCCSVGQLDLNVYVLRVCWGGGAGERVVGLKRGLWDARLFLPVLYWPLTRPGFPPASFTMPSCHSVLSGQTIRNFQNNIKHLTKILQDWTLHRESC